MIQRLLFFIFINILHVRCGKKSQNMDLVYMKDWNLPLISDYPLFFTLSTNNFKHRVLKSHDAWVVIVHRGKLNKLWRRHAELVKASVWYGLIDYDKEQKLAEEWAGNVSSSDLEFGLGLVFPFNRLKKKNLEFQEQQWPWKVKNPEEANKALALALPREIKAFTFTKENLFEFQDFVLNSFYESTPPRFPVLCIVDGGPEDVPVSTAIIARYFRGFFSFGLVWKEHLSRMLKFVKKVPQPKQYPHYMLLLGKEPSAEDMKNGKFGIRVDVFPFNPEKYGNPNHFLSVVKYLFTANEDYREVLLGRNPNESLEVQQMMPIRLSLTNRLKEVKSEYDLTVKHEL